MASRTLRRIQPHSGNFAVQSAKLHYSRPLYATAPTTSNTLGENKSTLSQERDPRLPPRPPLGTYPHPYPDARDDPHSNSMRLNYQHPISIRGNAGASMSIAPRTGSMSRSSYTQINSVLGMPDSIDPRENTITTPIYVIHVKVSSNNTIITAHAPSTPKPRTSPSTSASASSPTKKNAPSFPSTPSSSSLLPGQDAENFSVESNPDAAPVPEPTVSAEERADQARKDNLAAAKTLILPTADRCIGWASGGSCHYKKVNRSTYEAGYAASVRIIRRIEEAYQHVASGKKIEDLPPMKELKAGTVPAPNPLDNPLRDSRGIMRIRIIYNGFGTGRDAFNAAMLSAEGGFVRGLVGQVQDRTPVKVGGCRGRKTRRV